MGYVTPILLLIPSSRMHTLAGWWFLAPMMGHARTKSLLLAPWIDISKIVASFRCVSGYVHPGKSTSNATVCHISNSVHISHYELIYRCEGCWSWNHGGPTAAQVLARQCSITIHQTIEVSLTAPCPTKIILVNKIWD